MINLAISACLAGQNVRYDGQHKFMALHEYFDAKHYQLTPLCPEVEIGLGVPRMPIELLHTSHQLKLVQVDAHHIDHTEKMQQWVKMNKNRLSIYSGFILKSKSPSCGLRDTPHFDADRNFHLADGLFTTLIKNLFPQAAVISEVDIKHTHLLNQFKKHIKNNTIIQ